MKIKFYLLSSLFSLLSMAAFSQTAGDFRSAASGNWNDPATWQTFNGTSWVAASNYPTSTDGYIILVGGNTVTIPSAVSIKADQVLVQEKAQLLIAKDATLDLVNGLGTELDISQAVSGTTPGIVKVRGLLKANNEALISSTVSSLFVEDGGTYQHHYTMTNGNIPSANWGTGSTLLISGLTSSEAAPGNLSQDFHHVVWNTPDLNNTNDVINIVPGTDLKNIGGNLSILHSGSASLTFSGEATEGLSINNNFSISNNSNVEINGSVLVNKTLELSNSTLLNSGGLTLAEGATFLFEGTSVLNGVSPTARGGYSVHYKSQNTPVTTGLEFPSGGTPLLNLTVENGTLSLSNPDTVNGTLRILTSGTLLLNGKDIYLKGDFFNAGTLEAGTNKVAFIGVSPQLIEGTSVTTFYDLEILNSTAPGLTAYSPVNIINSVVLGEGVTFDPDGGDLATDGGNNVTLLSTSLNQAAFIAPVPATSQIAGNIVLQHYIPPVPMYRYLTTATKNLILDQWTDDFEVYGSYAGGPGGNASMYVYDEPQGKFLAYPGSSGSLSSPIEVGKGYTAYLDEATTPTIIDTRGRVISGGFSFPLTYTINSPVPGDNQIGNPYPSSIEWASPYWHRENVSPSIRIYKRVSGKNVYLTLNAITGIGLNAENTRIASGQAFFAEAIGPNPLLSATESVKIATASKPSIEDVIVVTLSNSTFQDQLALAFREGATENYDGRFDSKKIKNSSINLYSQAPDGKVIAQNVQNWFSCTLDFPMVIDLAPAGSYQLSFSHLESLSKEVDILLQDNFLNSSTLLTPETIYQFDITSDPLTYGSDRFSLILSYSIPEVTSITYTGSCSEEIPVTVNGTVAGKNYQLFKGTTAVTVPVAATSDVTSFMISKADLTEGINTISIQGAHPGCTPVSMATELQLDYSGSYTISSTTGATSCTTGAVTLTAAASSEKAFYRWYESSTAATPLQEGTAGTFTTPVLQQSATYYVAAVNAYGCESQRVAVEAVILAVPEVTSITYTGSCSEEIPVTVNGTVAGKNYQLFKGTTAVTVPVAATSDVTSFMISKADLTEGINTISIQGAHPGCTPVSMATELQLDYSGSYTISSTTGATSCTTGAVTLTAAASSEKAFYRWYESSTAATPLQEGTAGTFTTPVLQQSATYYVAAVNAYGCESQRVAVEAVIQNFEKPVIIIEDGKLVSSYTTGNQWLLNGSPIANANGTSFTPTEDGTYDLEVNNDGCLLLADEIAFTITGIDEEDESVFISLYPNPAQSSFKVEGTLIAGNTKGTYYIYQLNGTIVQHGSITNEENVINIESLDSGLFLIRIKAGEKVFFEKLIKR
ncbi:Ig-like domain-containing protein [Nafulsella turpanensis]|uniref:Ig-like domain-containing protein n=1 Tax=Nafulsella turpanensis TaxID=1265690 RepID=UPI00034CF780|nr:T9SS type A sorting domain-containing protein [Nafulsella turpanensis]